MGAGEKLSSRDVAVVLLAAGRSIRFGDADKLLAPFADRPLVLHAAAVLKDFGAGWRIAVCPSAEAPVARLLAAEGFVIVANPDAQDGLSSSLARGIGAAATTEAAAALVCLGDMPNIRGDHLQKLLAAFDPISRPAIASSSNGVAMPPALFARSLFAALMELKGDRGAKALLADAYLIPARPEILADIDAEADLARLHRAL